MNSSDIGLNKNCCKAARSFYRLNVIDNLPDIFVNELYSPTLQPGNYFMNNHFLTFHYELDQIKKFFSELHIGLLNHHFLLAP